MNPNNSEPSRSSSSRNIIIPLRMILPITSIGTFISAMDGSIVNVSLLTIANALNTDMEGIRWITIIYLLIISSLIGIGGSLGDTYGRKLIFQLGMLIFITGSLLCAFSPSLEILIISRIFQATGGAGLMANGLALVITYIEPAIRGRAIGVNSLVVASALSSGPVLGGILTEFVGWPSIFLINVPIGLLGILLVHRFIPETPKKRVQLDYRGMIIFILVTLSLVQGVLMLFKGDIIGSIFLVLSFIGGLIFIRIETSHPTPMISIRIMRNRTILIGMISSFLCYMVYYSVIFLLPFYYQEVLSFKQSQTGLLMVVPPFAMAIMGPFAGFLAEKIEAKRSTAFGAILLSAFVLALSFLFLIFPINTLEIVFLIVPLAALAAGSLTTFTVSNGTSIMNAAPKSDVSVVSGLIGLSRNIGFAFGTTVSSSFFALFFILNNPSNISSGNIFVQSYYTSLGQTFFIFALFAFVSAIISYLRGSSINFGQLS
ncbi:MFS transporter [Candidatus Hodarchaeum mangrovi]